MAVLLFSEWLADISEMHANNDYKITIVSMSELPGETVFNPIKSSHTTAECMMIISCKNSAQTAKCLCGRGPSRTPSWTPTAT